MPAADEVWVDRADPGDAEQSLPTHGRGPALAAVAVGGVIGAVARHGVDVALPTRTGQFPVGTFLVNVGGCLLLGMLAGWLYGPGRHRLLVPFVVTGVLGGFTTFSAYTVQVVDLGLRAGLNSAAGYLFASVVAGLVAVELGFLAIRFRGRDRPGDPIRW